MPCNLQPAIAGSNSELRLVFVSPAVLSGVEDWVLRNGCLQTPSGPEGSSGKQDNSCAVGEPGRSRLMRYVWENLVKVRCTAIIYFCHLNLGQLIFKSTSSGIGVF